jgi:tripeptide aminopeptidase
MDFKSTIFPTVEARFLKYVSFPTQSSESSESCPSTEGQRVLATYIVDELRQMGVTGAALDPDGYVYASLPATAPGLPSIGFIAHLDTAPDAPGDGIHPRVVSFDGQPIQLNADRNIVLSAADYPELNHYIGQDIIVTDGTTLLGADDKAGVAEIVSAAEFLVAHPELKHGPVKIAFTPDEEIGRGADHFDVSRFAADWAYTMDGGEVGELEYENFNAASAVVRFHGRNIHPGSAKGHLLNASKLALLFQSLLPAGEVPELTEGREGFFHLISMRGEVEEAELHYIIRDHNRDLFEQRKDKMRQIADFVQLQFGSGSVELELKDQYYNMIEKIQPVMHIVERARRAMAASGIQSKESPVRGGTDGAMLSFKGLPCPNIFAGGLNFHGRFEFLPVSSLQAAVRVILGILIF